MAKPLAYGVVVAASLIALSLPAVPACAARQAQQQQVTFDGPPDTPDERYRAILPVLAEELRGVSLSSPQMRNVYAQAARSAGVTQEEIEEWTWKARSGARVKLLTPAQPSLRELQSLWQGTWQIHSRYAGGRLTETQGLQFNAPVPSAANVLQFDVLTMESGIAHSFVNAATGDDQAFSMGALVTVTATTGGPIGDNDASDAALPAPPGLGPLVRGPNAGDRQPPPAPRRPPHIQVQFKGEITGSYGEFKKSVPIEMGMRYQKLGGDYIMVGSIRGPSGVGGIDEYEVSTWGPAQMSTVITNLDLMDTSTRIAEDARPAGMTPREYWNRLRQSNFETVRNGTCKVTDLKSCLK